MCEPEVELMINSSSCTWYRRSGIQPSTRKCCPTRNKAMKRKNGDGEEWEKVESLSRLIHPPSVCKTIKGLSI